MINIERLMKDIAAGEAIRADLIALRDEMKDEKAKRALAYALEGDFRIFSDLLKHEDPKVRSNSALILGQLETEDVLPFLFHAYMQEETLFVRPSYLKAMEELDCREYVPQLEKQLARLGEVQITDSNRKHIGQERRALRSLLLQYRSPKAHSFTGYDVMPDVILLTNKAQREATGEQIGHGEVRYLTGGLRVNSADLDEIMQIRTWREMLFPIPGGAKVMGSRPEEIAQSVAQLHLPQFLDELHRGGGTYYYRLDIRTREDKEDKGRLIRRVSDALEDLTDGRLVNSADHYEAELRLVEQKAGGFLPLLKLYTIKDKRFDYRKEFVASSLTPVNAALIARLTSKWMKEGAQILDPFCGVGTLLIERDKAVKAGTVYGIDTFGEAIEKGRVNADNARMLINYINRDYFDFRHEYLFDEIITDLPVRAAEEDGYDLKVLYSRFLDKSVSHLKKDGVMIVYTAEGKSMDQVLRANTMWKKEERFVLNEKTHAAVFVLKLV